MSFITPKIRVVTPELRCRCGSEWQAVTIRDAKPLSEAGRWVVCPNPACIVKIEGKRVTERLRKELSEMRQLEWGGVE